jgi:ATP-binding cassette subfamily F protein 3
VLSGGEKARVALAKTIASKANFLMLDEPTNHLDIHSVDLLVESLNKYEGTIVLVSHDRYFISRIANKIWDIEDYKIREFKGTYAEYEDWKERKAKTDAALLKEAATQRPADKQAPAVKEAVTKTEVLKPVTLPTPSSQNNGIDKELKKELTKQKTLFKQLEEKIADLTKKKAQLELDLALPDVYGDKTKFLQTETAYNNAANELTKANTEYEIVFEKLMELEEKI